MGVFRQLLKSHNSHCGCNYCIKLSKYVSLKKLRCSRRRRYYSDEYYDSRIAFEGSLALERLDRLIQSVKEEKDKLKII